MKLRCYFCELHSDYLINMLEHNGVKYKVVDKNVHSPLVVFNIYEIAGKRTLLDELKKNNVVPRYTCAEYSLSEYENSRLLTMRPMTQKFDIINCDDAYEYSCVRKIPFKNEFITLTMHEKQVGLFAIAKEPLISKKVAFWCESTGFSEIFADYRILELVKQNNLLGIEFKKVLLKNELFSDKLFQMTTENVLTRDCIGFGYGEKKIFCHICGKEQYEIDNSYQLHLNFSKIDLKNDLFLTERIFGSGIAAPKYIISQRFYRLLKENGLAGKVVFEPVVDISSNN